MFQPWVLLVLGASITGAIARILQKKVMMNPKHDSMALSFLFQFMAAVIFFIYSKATNTFEIPNLWTVWPHVIAMIFLYAAGNILSFLAFEHAEASEASILFPTSTIWAVLTAVIFLGEQLSVWQIVGIAVVILGIIFTYFEKSSWRFNKGHVFALLSSFLYGIAFTNDVYILKLFQSVSSYMFMIFLLPSLVILFFKPKLTKSLASYFSSIKISNMLISAVVLYCFSSIAYFTAYKVGGQASLISPIFQTSVILTVFLSVFFLGERKHLLQKAIGCLVTIAGVILLITT